MIVSSTRYTLLSRPSTNRNIGRVSVTCCGSENVTRKPPELLSELTLHRVCDFEDLNIGPPACSVTRGPCAWLARSNLEASYLKPCLPILRRAFATMMERTHFSFTCKGSPAPVGLQFGAFPILARLRGGSRLITINGILCRARNYLDFKRLLRLANIMTPLNWRASRLLRHSLEKPSLREAAGSAMAAHVFWQDAIRAFRDRPSLCARIPELQ